MENINSPEPDTSQSRRKATELMKTVIEELKMKLGETQWVSKNENILHLLLS